MIAKLVESGKPFVLFCATILTATGMAAPGSVAQPSRSLRDLPHTLPFPIKPAPAQEESILTDMPRDMILLGEWNGWWPGDFAQGRLPGRKYSAPAPGRCRIWHDYIDLARVRANGFRVSSYQLIPAMPQSGYLPVNSQFVTPLKTEHGRYLNAHDLAEIDRLDITPQGSTPDAKAKGNARFACLATWQLAIHVRGPKGVDPYTGAPK